jgi:hypothetical protein
MSAPLSINVAALFGPVPVLTVERPAVKYRIAGQIGGPVLEPFDTGIDAVARARQLLESVDGRIGRIYGVEVVTAMFDARTGAHR